MGLFDWLFGKRSNPTKQEPIEEPVDHNADRPINLRLVPGAFDPDGDAGDLMWFGCTIEDQYGNRYGHQDNRLQDAGFYIFNVAGVTKYKKALRSDAFAPPSWVQLVCEDDNPYDKNAVSVWSADRTQHVGYVPRDLAPAIRNCLEEHPTSRALVLAHCLNGKRRVALTILCGPLDGVK